MHNDYENDVVCIYPTQPQCSAAKLTAFQLTPQLLKPAVSAALINLMAPIQAAYQASTEWQEIALKAYPPAQKKQKKVKDKGSRHPGRKDGEGVGAAESLVIRTADAGTSQLDQ